MEATAPETATLATEESSPTLTRNFGGLEDTGWLPPDSHGAVGPNHLMVTVNGGVRVQDRSGNAVSTTTLVNWWSALGPFPTNSVFDPRVLYDPYGQRWINVALSDGRNASSSLLVAVSASSDPTGDWYMHRFDADALNQKWADFPMIGFNKNWIVVQEQMFAMPGFTSATTSKVYAFNKSRLYGGGSPSCAACVFDLSSSLSGWQAPATTYDPNLEAMYLLQNWNGNSNGSGYLRLHSITGTADAPQFNTPEIYPSTSSPWASNAPETNFAPQLGSAQKLNVGDSRMQNVVYRNGSLWATQNAFLPASGPTRVSAQWWQINPTNGAVSQFGRMDDPTANKFYAYPSISVNKNNDVMLGYSRFSGSQYASANYSVRRGTDPLNTMGPDTVLKAGEAPYYKVDGIGRNRWGDYSATVVDPNNDTDFWTLQEYAESPSNVDRWGTWWGAVTPQVTVPNDSFANATALAGANTTANGSNVGATKEAGEPNHVGNAGGKSVWYRWTPQASGPTTIDTAGSSFDTLLAVYTGGAVNGLTGVASNDDDPAGGVRTSKVSFTATAGTTYRIAVDGYNDQGAGAASGNITLNVGSDVDNTNPSAALTAPANDAVVEGAAVNLAADASDNVGVTGVEFLVDGQVVGTDTSSPYSTIWNSTTKSDGFATVTARASDAAGNTGTSAGRRVAVDNTTPDTTITNGPAAGSTTANATASFAFTSTERDSTFRCKLDDEASFTQCSSPKTYTGLPQGGHTFQVRAIGAGGEANDSDPTPDSRTWTVGSSADLQTFEENDPDRTGYAGWYFYRDGNLSGGRSAYATAAGNTAAFKFKGTRVAWKTARFSNSGKTAVYLDGKKVKTFDAYAPNPQYNVTGYARTGLPNKVHTIKLVLTGTRNASSGGIFNDIDRFVVGSRTYQEDAPQVTYGSWRGAANPGASGGSYRLGGTVNPAYFFDFTGPRVDLITARGPSFGTATVEVVDSATNAVARTVTLNLNSPTTQWQVRESITGLDPSKTYFLRVFSADGRPVVVDSYEATPAQGAQATAGPPTIQDTEQKVPAAD